jgi:hypothetical protein
VNDSPWLPRLYAAVAVATIVPIWCVKYLPTGDGPSHVYNAWILRELVRGTHGPIAQWFRIDWRPHPNWIGHAAMALLMIVVKPVVAEKLFLSGVIVLFLYAMWRFAAMKAAAFVAVPFAYNLMLQYGFYNFCAGLGFYFLTIAVWWQRRERADARSIAIVAALLLACYSSHPIPAVLAIGSIGLLWLVALRGRHAQHLLAFLPVAALFVWFMRMNGTAMRGGKLDKFEFLMRLRILYAFDKRQLVYTTAIAALLAALIIATLLRRRTNAFIILWVAMIVIYAFSPSAVGGGSIIQERMALFVALTPLAFIDLRLPPRAAAAFAIVLAVLALAYDGYIIHRYRILGAHMQRFVRSAGALGRQMTFLPVLYEIGPPDNYVPIYVHAADYAAIEKQAVDVANYEPLYGYFPIALRPGVAPTNILALTVPWSLNLDWYPRAQCVFTWRMDADPAMRAKLETRFAFVAGRDSGAVFCVK